MPRPKIYLSVLVLASPSLRTGPAIRDVVHLPAPTVGRELMRLLYQEINMGLLE